MRGMLHQEQWMASCYKVTCSQYGITPEPFRYVYIKQEGLSHIKKLFLFALSKTNLLWCEDKWSGVQFLCQTYKRERMTLRHFHIVKS